MTFYYTLITSLPRNGRHFKVKQTPISRIQLEKRLKMLTEPEKKILTSLIFLVWDSWFDPRQTFSAVMSKEKMLIALKNPFINELIQWFFDLRSVFAALRLRKTQLSPPENKHQYWATRWNIRLIDNWSVPDFGLKYIYHWLPDVSSKMAASDTDAVEEVFLSQIWRHLDNIESRHFYDFEALIIYLLRWNVVNYWSQFNEKIAQERICELSGQIMENST